MRLGIFGGSFDPVHNAHLAIARTCQQQARLDEVWFTPTAIQPLKHEGPRATDTHRLEMLRIAIRNEPSWRVCTIEIDRGGFSYTVDTLRQIREELPDADLFFLIGADALQDVAKWREPREIFRLATPLVVCRATQPSPDFDQFKLLCTPDTQPQSIEMNAMDVSSSEIRRRIVAGTPIDDLVPDAVAKFITQHRLYSQTADGR
jgi:nicotinate-nucleotide adenylyltransferase